MSNQEPILATSDIVLVLPCLPEKFIVDFANGIDVARDHLRVQRERTSFSNRLYDGFTGKGAKRQAAINASLTDGVEASLTWLSELSGSLANSNLAISRVNDRVSALKLDVARIAGYSADTRKRLEKLADDFGARCEKSEKEIARIDFVQKAHLNLEEIFNKWKAERYHSFSLAGRCYAALEELRWGAFGDYCRNQPGTQRQKFIDDLKNRSIAQLAHDARQSAVIRLDTRTWLSQPTGHHVLPDAEGALAFMGDWSNEDSPFVYSTTQLPSNLPQYLPRISSPHRLIDGLVTEVFEVSAYV